MSLYSGYLLLCLAIKLEGMKLLPGLSDLFLNKVFDNDLFPITRGISLKGQAIGPPEFSNPRQ
ncbi:unnamed protein product, partial [Clonostachys rhizophaga]